jgi:hypothetical protein
MMLTGEVGGRGSTVVKVLRYISEGYWFDPRWCHWNFSLKNTSDRTMALGSTQPLTEMSTKSLPGGKGGRSVGLTTLSPSCAVVKNSWNLSFLEPSESLQACNGTALPLLTGENGSTRKKITVTLRPSQVPHGPARDLILGLCDERPANKCLDQGTVRCNLDWRFSWQC